MVALTQSDLAQQTSDAAADDPALDRPIRRRRWSPADLIDLGAAGISAAAVVGVLREVFGWRGVMAPGLWWYAIFLLVYYVLQRDRSSEEGGLDRVVTVLLWSIGILVISALAWMLIFLVTRGLAVLRATFFTEDMAHVGPLNPGGGARAAIIGTVEQVGIATAVVVPIAILTAVYLHEHRGRLATPIRFIVDGLAGLPSIVAGLVVFTVWIVGHPNRFSGIAGSAALIILMLPTVTRTSEEVLRTVPGSLREASLALGAPQWRMVFRVVLPTALAGLVTASILGVARAVGETAPMLLTAGFSNTTNANPFSGPQADLPTFVWNLIFVPNRAQNNRAWTAALVLVILVLALFVTARVLLNRSMRKRGGGS